MEKPFKRVIGLSAAILFLAAGCQGHDLPPQAGLLDLELGQEPELMHHEWITDTSVDDQGGWAFVAIAGYKSGDRPLHWRREDDGLVIDTPAERPCDHAYVFKIIRNRSI